MQLPPVVVIPDIHGDIVRLELLLSELGRQGYLRSHKLVFLGDLIDRGFESAAVVELVRNLVAAGHTCIAGNHEVVLTMVLWEPDPEARATSMHFWLRGYEQHLIRSYGLRREELMNPEDLRAALVDQLEARGHATFLRSLPLYYEQNDLICVHAGPHPKYDWEHQRRMLDNRSQIEPPQLFSHELGRTTDIRVPGKCVASGHTPRRDKGPLVLPNRALLDAGCGQGGPLVAWVADENQLLTVDDTASWGTISDEV